jgi:hypothetical protein
MYSAYVAVSATFVCRIHLCASERAASGFEHPNRWKFGKRWYQQLCYTICVQVPVRYSSVYSTNLGIYGGTQNRPPEFLRGQACIVTK